MSEYWQGFISAFALMYAVCGIMYAFREYIKSNPQELEEGAAAAVLVMAVGWIFFALSDKLKEWRRSRRMKLAAKAA